MRFSFGVGLFVLAIFCFGIAWSIYFYTHMDSLCQMPIIGWEKECIGYNMQHH